MNTLYRSARRNSGGGSRASVGIAKFPAAPSSPLMYTHAADTGCLPVVMEEASSRACPLIPHAPFELPLSCFREASLLRTLVTGDGDEDVYRRLSRSRVCGSGTGAKLDVAVR